MEQVKKFFVEFKSIFTSEDVLKENETHANIVVAATMMNIFIVFLFNWLLNNVFHLLNFDQKIMNIVVVRGFFGLLLPAIICYILKGEKKYTKYILQILLISMLAMVDATLTFSVTLIMVIPLVLSARYYSKKFTIFVAGFTMVMFIISTCVSVYIGFIDLNYVEVPAGTVIETSLVDTVANLELDPKEQAIKLLVQSFLPKYALYIVIAFACIQISQSGKNMIERQEEISKKGARIESELELATNIQRNMLPSIFPPFPEHKEIDIYASMTPAKEVGRRFL